MHTAIDQLAARIAKPNKTALDCGCGAKPYASLFTSRGVAYVGADFGGAADVAITPAGIVGSANISGGA
jgi:hypothetical protein